MEETVLSCYLVIGRKSNSHLKEECTQLCIPRWIKISDKVIEDADSLEKFQKIKNLQWEGVYYNSAKMTVGNPVSLVWGLLFGYGGGT